MNAATVLGWHRKGFRLFWRWKIQSGKPEPMVPKEVRELIRTMSCEDFLYGARRICGELLKLGIEIGETSVDKYMVRHRKPPSQTWRTCLENHVKTMVSVDFVSVPTIRFPNLYVFLVLAHGRRRKLHFAVTAHPTADQNFISYYHRSRTYLALETDSPEPRPIQPPESGRIIAIPEVGGLHHRCERRAA